VGGFLTRGCVLTRFTGRLCRVFRVCSLYGIFARSFSSPAYQNLIVCQHPHVCYLAAGLEDQEPEPASRNPTDRCDVMLLVCRTFPSGVVGPLPLQSLCTSHLLSAHLNYRRTSISGTTFSGKKCLSGTIFHAI
jgi:hypothetical protein